MGVSDGQITVVAIRAAASNPVATTTVIELAFGVDKRGGAYWLLRLQRDGKRQDIGLGSATHLSLAEARRKSIELRKAVRVDRRDVVPEIKNEAAATVTFCHTAHQYHADNRAGWKSAVYARQWLASLENYAFPNLGVLLNLRGS